MTVTSYNKDVFNNSILLQIGFKGLSALENTPKEIQSWVLENDLQGKCLEIYGVDKCGTVSSKDYFKAHSVSNIPDLKNIIKVFYNSDKATHFKCVFTRKPLDFHFLAIRGDRDNERLKKTVLFTKDYDMSMNSMSTMTVACGIATGQ